MLQESLCPTTVLDLGALGQEMRLLLQPSRWSCDIVPGFLWIRSQDGAGKVSRAPRKGRIPVSVIPRPGAFQSLQYFMEPPVFHGDSFCRISSLQTQTFGNEIQSLWSHFGLKYKSDTWILVSTKNPKMFFFLIALVVKPKRARDTLCALNHHYCFTRRYCSVLMPVDNIFLN